MLKRDAKVLTAGIIIGSLSIGTAFATGVLTANHAATTVLVDGNQLELGDPAVFISSEEWGAKKLYMPVRDLVESLGYEVEWDGDTDTVLISTGGQPADSGDVFVPEAYTVDLSGLHITVNPLVEMLSVVEYLSTYDEDFGILTKLDLPYKDEVETAFRPFAGHEAVALFESMYINDGFSFDRPPGSMLLINRDFTIDKVAYALPANERYSMARLQQFADALKDFYVVSDFGSFYMSHQDYYEQILKDISSNMPAKPLIPALESFFGETMGYFEVIPVSLFHTGGFGPSIQRAQRTEIYSVTGPISKNGEMPSFGTSEGFEYLQLHEFGHSFIELMTEELAPYLEKTAYLFEPIKEDMTQKIYPTWDMALEEIILRATTVKIQREDHSAAALSDLKAEYDEGYVYIETVYESLMKYEEDRKTYSTFDDFLPVIMEDLLIAHPQGAK